MTDEEEIKKLKAEIRRLRADIDGLKAFVKHESDDVTRHILILQKHVNKIQKSLIDAYDYIWPMVEKVLPEFGKATDRVHQVLGTKKRPPG